MTYNKIILIKEEEKKKILNLLNEQFGIKSLQGILLKRGKERLFLFKGNLDQLQIEKIEEKIPIERIGIYFAKIIENKKTQKTEIRLSIDGVHLFKDQITKNIFNIENEQILNQWMQGLELNIMTSKKGFFVIKYKNDFLGCGKISKEKITNFIPKNRRIKNKESS